MARSRYIIAKKPNEWTENQKNKSGTDFQLYPLLHKAYKHTLEFRNIYEQTDNMLAREKFSQWIDDTKQLEMNVFNTAANSIKYHLETILNFSKKDLQMQMLNHSILK